MTLPIRHLLFDFGDTLAREPFCINAPPGVPDWEAHVLATYEEDGLGDRWCAGELMFPEVAAAVARRCGMEVEATRAAMNHDWRNLRLNLETIAFARELGRRGRAAVVTVNPDIFTHVIAPHYGLHDDFPVVVTSWQERTLDKVVLCEIALELLGAPGDLPSTLLIDNRADNVEAFRAQGGQAHLFTTDEEFARAIPDLRARLR